MPDQTVEAGPVLRLPEDLMKVQEIVATVFKGHEDHVRDRTCLEVSAYLQQRAERLRDTQTLDDPLAWALTQSCHIQDGVVHASPSVVAATAYEVVAAVLSLGDPTRDVSELAGRDRTDSNDPGAIRNGSERSETEGS
jgi:hypothetical protein